MAPRSCWKGFLRLSLVAVPVKAYSATASGGGDIHLNQLHAQCHSRIQYKKVCPLHGEVASEDIVSAYEYTRGQYVVIDTQELDLLRTEADKAITIHTFIGSQALDPIYQTDKTYYLVPDGSVGQKPYGVLVQALGDENLQAIAQMVLHGKEQTVLLRVLENLMVLTVLKYDHQVSKPSTMTGEIMPTAITSEELQLAKTLIAASTMKHWDMGRYADRFREKLTTLIEVKVAGQQLVAPPVQDYPQVINLMEALRQSVAQLHDSDKEAVRPSTKEVSRNGKVRKKKSP